MSVGVANVTVYLYDEQYAFEVVVTTPEISTNSIKKVINDLTIIKQVC